MTEKPRDLEPDPGGEGEVASHLMSIWGDGEAEVVRRLLDTYGIPCQVISTITHSIFPLSVDGLGEIKIYVPASRLEEAKALVAEHRRQGMEMVPPESDADAEEAIDEPEQAEGGEGG